MRIGERFRSQLFWCNSETFGFKSIWRHFYQRKLFSISQSVCDNDDRCLQKKKWQEEATLYVHVSKIQSSIQSVLYSTFLCQVPCQSANIQVQDPKTCF